MRTTRVEVVEGLGGKKGLDAAALYDRLSPGVVTIMSLFDEAAASLLAEDGGEGGQGSGFVLDGEGYIATNAHVVTTGDAPDTERAKEVFVEFSDGNRVPAEIVGDDPNADVALIKVDPRASSSRRSRSGHSDDLVVGEPVAAIGSPFGERQSLSVGVVSAVDRNIESLTQLPDRQRDPDRRRDQPRQLRRAAAQRARARCSASTRRSSPPAAGARASASRSRWTPCAARCASCATTARVDYGYLGVTSQPLYPQLAERLDLPVATGALIVRGRGGQPRRQGRPRGRRRRSSSRVRPTYPGGDVIVGVDGRKLTRATTSPT